MHPCLCIAVLSVCHDRVHGTAVCQNHIQRFTCKACTLWTCRSSSLNAAEENGQDELEELKARYEADIAIIESSHQWSASEGL